jgi:hypothetical protein
MQCREFREISESYLSDELLVETNVEVHRHLEDCAACRADLASRREFRVKLIRASGNAKELRIDPAFADKLHRQIKEAALAGSPWQKLLLTPKIVVPALALASILIATTIGFVYLQNSTNSDGLSGVAAIPVESVSKALTELSLKAAGKHQICALELLGVWEAQAPTDYTEKAVYTNKVLEPLRAKTSASLEMLSVHDCVYQGRQFKHVVLRDGSNIVSVFITDSEDAAGSHPAETIMSEVENGMRVASFYDEAKTVLVVSQLPETENLNFARTLLNAWRQA